MTPDLGDRFTVPESISPTKVIQIVGRERNEPDKRVKIEGTGKTVLYCCQVVDGKTSGTPKALGSDLFSGFKLVV